ncbi:CPBP family intramembrane glutamic endopeptidase [Sphingomicrobium sediminis]|uniref:CPBP family intramembrane metalloprotease n=1 Tax=Sphingomicrobium sediminis TaxID=2950949 RepID=A0A9X2J2M3_9SPHN|nr:CPBP family intramembrane glutamic endopeptidase [Sphingomicrobium sediminis]MCM8558443.1 CPBP family intramembrane metalloprotease [Sphingomicrobium sediminis]
MTTPWRDSAHYFLLAVAVTYAVWFATMPLVPLLGRWVEGLAIIGPTVAALWMVRKQRPFEWLAERFRDTQVKAWWLLVPLGLYALAAAVSAAIGPPPLPEWQSALALFAIQIVITAIPEEIGWRAYLTPKLMQVANPLVASMIVGVFWGLWHGPKLLFIPTLPLLCIALSILMTYACFRLRGGLPLAILIHGSFNGATFWAANASNQEQSLLALNIIIAILSCGALLLLLAKRRWFFQRTAN